MSLEGKVALVTGASMPKGIGKAIALALARDGADVAVTGFSHMDGVKAVAEECPVRDSPCEARGTLGPPSPLPGSDPD